jgi:hypothetical protein
MNHQYSLIIIPYQAQSCLTHGKGSVRQDKFEWRLFKPTQENRPPVVQENGSPLSVLYSYPSIALRSASTVVVGFRPNFSTSTLSTLEEKNAGIEGPT